MLTGHTILPQVTIVSAKISVYSSICATHFIPIVSIVCFSGDGHFSEVGQPEILFISF